MKSLSTLSILFRSPAQAGFAKGKRPLVLLVAAALVCAPLMTFSRAHGQNQNIADDIQTHFRKADGNGSFTLSVVNGKKQWIETAPNDPAPRATFVEINRDKVWVFIFDATRNLRLALPLAGGMSKWSNDNGGTWNDLVNVVPAVSIGASAPAAPAAPAQAAAPASGVPAASALPAQESQPAKDFVSGIPGTSWTFNYNGAEYPLTFEQDGTISMPQWVGVKWEKISGNQVRINNQNGLTMIFTFDSPTSYKGASWGDGLPVWGSPARPAAAAAPAPVATPVAVPAPIAVATPAPLAAPAPVAVKAPPPKKKEVTIYPWGADPKPLAQVSTDLITITTNQRILSQIKNPSKTKSLTRKVSLTSKTSMQKNDFLEKIKEDTSKVTVGAEISLGFESTEGSSAKVGDSGAEQSTKVTGSTKLTSSYEATARDYLKTTGSTDKGQSKEITDSTEFEVDPLDTFTLYQNISSGGGFEYNYMTNLANNGPVSDEYITVTSTLDMNPIFQKFLNDVVWSSRNTNSDSGMWGMFGDIAIKAQTDGERGFYTYIDGVTADYFSPRSDEGSWNLTKEAAARAKQEMIKGNKKKALLEVLLGFHRVNNPSHNGGLWQKCGEVGQAWLNPPQRP